MDKLVSTSWLAAELGAPDLVVLDASLHLPSAGRDAADEFADTHIDGARFLSLATLHDPASSLPGKVPDAKKVAERLASLGVDADSRIVLYDDSALRTACRAWFLLTTHGLDKVAVLDGGLAKWKAEKRPLSDEPVKSDDRDAGDPPSLSPDRGAIRSKREVLDDLATYAEQLVDARDEGRFTGETVDTVHDLPGGHIPGARNLPFTRLFAGDGTFLPASQLAQQFRDAGIDPQRPVVAYCGSGVTASVLMFALALIGAPKTALYDGSWAEWGSDPATPKQTGEAR